MYRGEREKEGEKARGNKNLSSTQALFKGFFVGGVINCNKELVSSLTKTADMRILRDFCKVFPSPMLLD